MVTLRTVSVLSVVLLVSIGVGACAGSAEPDTRKAERATAKIPWPAVSSVLDGTDLVEMKAVSVTPLDVKGVEGRYRSEEGGSVLSLTVRRADDGIQVERTYREPGRKPATKEYEFRTITPEGAASSRADAFLKKTSEGLLLFEKQSGVESIPASYWVHYIRRQ